MGVKCSVKVLCMNDALTMSNKNESFIWEKDCLFSGSSLLFSGASSGNLAVMLCDEFSSESAKRCESYMTVFWGARKLVLLGGVRK